MKNECIFDGYAFLPNLSVLEICDANIIVISPEMKGGYLLLKMNSLIISLYKTNDDVVAQLTPCST